jgi:ribosomal protein S27AE
MKFCPKCGSSNFYDQYHQNAFPEPYAMCKNCGYWKKENEEVRQCNIFYHDCKGNKQPLPPAGHPRKGFCWGFGDEIACEYCDEIIKEKAKWPAEDINHPFHKL